jgi:hypothetical protein
MTMSTPPAIELNDLTKSAAINLPSTLARHASATARVNGFDVAAMIDGCDALVARCVTPAGVWR